MLVDKNLFKLLRSKLLLFCRIKTVAHSCWYFSLWSVFYSQIRMNPHSICRLDLPSDKRFGSSYLRNYYRKLIFAIIGEVLLSTCTFLNVQLLLAKFRYFRKYYSFLNVEFRYLKQNIIFFTKFAPYIILN